MGDDVSQGSCHGQSWDIHVSEPHTRWTINSVIVLNCKDTASTGDDAFLLFWRVWLVIERDLHRDQVAVLFFPQHDTRVANVHASESVAPNDGHRQCSSAEFCVDSEIAKQVSLHLGDCISDGRLQIRGPGLVVEHLGDELITEPRRDVVTVLSVTIQNAQDQTVGVWVVCHDQCVLILFPWVVRCVPLLGHSGIFGDCATHWGCLLLLLRLLHFGGVGGCGLGNTIDVLARSCHGQTAAHFLEALAENPAAHSF
mmetsp:Transcript_5101/g.13664  ORF Transcript_5101/g.13664 Transcript_5101/m.13664 type:complete len:255 (-) Transcript_5101:18-782(-)